MSDVPSLCLTFTWNTDRFLLAKVMPNRSPAPFNKLERRTENMSGFWVQTEDETGDILFWSPFDLEYEINWDNISVMVPYNHAINTISACLPSKSNGKPQIERFDFSLADVRKEWEVLKNATEPSLPCDICNEGRGQVLKKVTVKYYGYTEHIYNLVLLSDKFKASQLDDFRTRANRCIEHLLSNPPFNTAIGSATMNVYFVEIDTTDPGQPYFHVDYEKGSTHVEWSTDNVTKVCDALFSDSNGIPYWTWAGVLINETDQVIGTAITGGRHFTCGNYKSELNCADYVATFRHEFSHTAFCVRDEYSTDGKGRYTGGEPVWANVTTNLDRNTIKWKSFLSANVPLPTTGEDSDVVGAFEGAMTYETGIYRPQKECIMRDSNNTKYRYCKVCENEAMLVVAKSFGIHVTAPGVLTYSPIAQQWSQVSVIFESSEALLAKQVGETYYQSLWKQLACGNVTGDVGKLFEEATGEKLSESTVLIEGQSGDSDDYGVWYLSIDGCSKMYYFYLSSFAKTRKVCVGCINTPPYLTDSTFDGVLTGQILHAFCIDGYRLAYGQMNFYNIKGVSFKEQTVSGIDDRHMITALSVANFSPIIFVAVVDAGTIKMGAYELINQSWSKEGFIAMPQETDESYFNVKIVAKGNEVYVVAKSDSGLVFATFDPINRRWSAEKKQVSGDTQDVLWFDVAVWNKTAIITATIYEDESGKECGKEVAYIWNVATNAWEQQVLNTDQVAVSSYGTTILGNELHCIMLKDMDAIDTVYDVSYNGTSYQLDKKREDMVLPLSEHREIGAFVLHSDGSQIYLVLSGRTKLPDADTDE